MLQVVLVLNAGHALHAAPPCSLRLGFLVLGFRAQGSGFGVQGLGFRVRGSGFGVQGSGFKVEGRLGLHHLGTKV